MKNFRNFSEVKAALDQGQFSVSDLVQYYLSKISENQHLNAFVEVFENASQCANLVDDKLRKGSAGKLAGMVIGVKDVIAVQNQNLTAGSRILSGFKSPSHATVIQRLVDEDAIIIGRQNCDEFAMGSSSESSCFGPVKNADDNHRVPGGSSGGSAVAVQADLCFASIGSDTGGSVRQPAAFCGVVGLKPTYSSLSRNGLIAYGSSFDCIGPITRSVEDAALLFRMMAGKDPMDATSSHWKSEEDQKERNNGKLKIACFGLNTPGLQPEVRQALDKKVKELESQQIEVVHIDLPFMESLLPTYYILTTAEASSNLSRFDGVRYGHRSPSPETLEALYKKSRAEGFGAEVKKRILLGTYVLSADYYNAYYTKAQKVRRLIRESAEAIFRKFDFFLMPTTPETAFFIGAKSDPLAMYYADIFTVWANLAGVPAISVPTGRDNAGMPIGIQAHAPWFHEDLLLTFAEKLINVQS